MASLRKTGAKPLPPEQVVLQRPSMFSNARFTGGIIARLPTEPKLWLDREKGWTQHTSPRRIE